MRLSMQLRPYIRKNGTTGFLQCPPTDQHAASTDERTTVGDRNVQQ